VTEKNGNLRVTGHGEVDRDELGDPGTYNLGYGPDILRWSVRSGSGAVIVSGEIKVCRAFAAPPRPGESAVHFTPPETSFTLRVPFPAEASAVMSADGRSKPVKWKP
jgi:hypothetical protein